MERFEQMDFNPLIQYIRMQLPDVLAIYAFGSRVRNEDNALSDLDLAVLLPRPIP